MQKLSYYKINNKYNLLIDADNVFWAIKRGNIGSNRPFQSDLMRLYLKLKDKLDSELNDFRFSANLTAIYIDPTERCNASCPYCYIPASIRKNGRTLTAKELNFILEKIAKYFSRNRRKAVIVFHASEPLLVKDIIFRAIEKFKNQFKFGLQTNAILLEREDVEFLKKQGVGVGISLDSNLAYVNNRLRPTRPGDGNFQQAVKAIEWFNGYAGLNVITTITKLNVSHLPGMVKFLHRKKVPCLLLNPVRLTQASSRHLKPDEKLLTKYFLKAVDTAIALSKESDHGIIVGNFANLILAIIAPTARRLMCDISPCGGGRCFLTITAKGNMIPCGEFIGLRGFSGGNIFKTSIGKAMKSLPFRKLRARSVEKINECNICILRNICGAPCPAELNALGGMFEPSVFCEFYKKAINYAFRIIAEGKEKYCFRRGSLDNLRYTYLWPAYTAGRKG